MAGTTVCEDGFNLGFVSWLELDDGPSCEGGQHGGRDQNVMMGSLKLWHGGRELVISCGTCCCGERINYVCCPTKLRGVEFG